MKNLKELIKPGYIVDIADSELEEYRYIVVDALGGLGLHSIYEPGYCISLSNFDDALINELLIINPYEYIDWLEIWKREFEHTKLDSIVFCYVFLLKVDEIICVFNKLNKPIESVGPLTGNDEYYLYFKPPEAYFSTRLATGKIRRGRQTVEYGVNSINYDFKNFS